MTFNNDFQPSTLTEEELKAAYAKKLPFSRLGSLAKKGVPQPYWKEKRTAYHLNRIGILLSHVLRIFAAYMFVFGLFKGVFGIAGEVAAPIAFVFSAGLLVALEFRQHQNATQLLERWFFRDMISHSNIIMGVVLSLITLGLSLAGADDTVVALSKTVNPVQFDESRVNPTLLTHIAKEEADAAEFYKARSWKGKLSPEDGKKYAEKKAKVSQLRDEYRKEVGEAKGKAETDYGTAIASKQQTDNQNTTYVIFLLIFTEICFYFFFFHKERYEFLSRMEAEHFGQIKKLRNPTTPPPAPPAPPQNGQHSQNGQHNPEAVKN